MSRVGDWQRRYLPAAAIRSAIAAAVFTGPGFCGLALIALGAAYEWRSALPLMVLGGMVLGAVAGGSYVHAMRHLGPSLIASDEDREIAKLRFEVELRKLHVRNAPPSIMHMVVINEAAEAAQQIGVPAEDLQEIANRLYQAAADDEVDDG